MELIILDKIDKVTDILDYLADYPTLKYIVVMEKSIPPEVKRRAQTAGVELLVFADCLELGANNLMDPIVSIPLEYNDTVIILILLCVSVK